MRRHTILIGAILSVMIASCLSGQSVETDNEPVIGGPCEGCDAVFYGMPDSIGSTARIAPASEPGEPLIIDGIVTTLDGDPAQGVIVYAYHTNDKGIYPYDSIAQKQYGVRHGKLRGWVKTDSLGRYRFETIRPKGYPQSDNPQHIHMHIIEPGRFTYYIDDIMFEDDPRLSEEFRSRSRNARGASGIAMPTRDDASVWRVTRNIVLGKNIPGYEK